MRTRNLGYRPHCLLRVCKRGCASLCAQLRASDGAPNPCIRPASNMQSNSCRAHVHQPTPCPPLSPMCNRLDGQRVEPLKEAIGATRAGGGPASAAGVRQFTCAWQGSDWARARTRMQEMQPPATDEAHASETPFSGHSWISVLVYATWASLNHLPSNVRVLVGSAYDRVHGRPSPAAAHPHAIARASMSVHVAAANTLHAEEDAPNITEARPGSLRTSSTAVPCDLEQKKWTW